MSRLQIGIIGSAGDEEYPNKSRQRKKVFKLAEETGKILAQKGVTLVTGGKGGIMKSASKGAKSAGGITIGVVRGKKRFTTNPFVDVEIVSGMEGCSEEIILVLCCDGLIALGGGAGTLQELVIAYRNKKPVVILDTGYGWASKLANSFLDERKNIKLLSVQSPKEAVDTLLKTIKC